MTPKLDRRHAALIQTAVIARWISEDRCTAFALQADGTLLTSHRQTPTDVWPFSQPVAKLGASIQSFEDYLGGLTSA